MLVLAAGCSDPTSGDGPDRVLSAAGTAVPEAPVTVPPPTTVTTTAPTTVTRPAVTSTTVRRTATTAPRPATTRVPVTPAPPIAGYSRTPPPPGVVADGYGGYGGVTTKSFDEVTVELSVYPRESYFGEPVQVRVELTTTEMASVKIDMGNGTVFDPAGDGGVCSIEPHKGYGGAPFYVYPEPGQYTIRAIVTMIPCIAIPGPPGSPPGAPSPFASDRYTVEVSMGFIQRPDRPPPPVGPPPGR